MRRPKVRARGRLGRWSCTGLAAAAFLLLALASSVGASGAQQRGLYLALGASTAYGTGASSPSKSYVQLYYGYLQSNGSGVTELLNMSYPGWTSTDLRTNRLVQAVAAINDPSTDTKAVTIDIGWNDILGYIPDPKCPTANAAACPFAANLRAMLTALNAALAADPGAETVQVMEMYNANMGTPDESASRQLLLGSDGKVDCAGTGAAVGLSDLTHCIAIELGATTVDVLPIFDAAGAAYLAADHQHPNDAGHLAIAKAFGGAATPTTPPPPPPPPPPAARCSVPSVKGKTLAAAAQAITAGHCSTGNISRAYSKTVKKGRVISQKPGPGASLPNGSKVALVVSRGKKR
jgi:lysophospholipase L1-like esterase